jgi:hypothetical protein
MAPEQRAGIPADARADQFAFAVALGEAIASRRPFADASAADVVALVAERRTREPALDTLCAAIARGLAIDPAERHADMTAFADAIEASVTVLAAPAPVRRRRSAGLVAVVAIAAAGGGVAIWLATRDSGSRSLEASAAMPNRSSAETPAPPGAAEPTGTAMAIQQPNVGATQPTGATTTTEPRATQPTGAATPTRSDAATSTIAGARPDDMRSTTALPGAATPTGARGDVRSTQPVTLAKHAPAPTARPLPTGAPAPISDDAAPSRDDDHHITAAPAPTPPPTQPADPAPNLADVDNAVRRHDGPGCRAALLKIPPSTNVRYLYSHAYCEMTAGNCDGGTRELEAALARQGAPATSAPILADQICPLGTDPAVRLRRLIAQTGRSASFDCDYYLAPARAAATAASTEADRHTAGTVLATLARCFSIRGRCDDARAALHDAQRMIPTLDEFELAAACR